MIFRKIFGDVGRLIWFCVGAAALILGLVGVFLPVLPTTPFIILAAFAFGKSVPQLQTWLYQTRIFGPLLQNWDEHGAIAPRYKVMALTMMAAVFLFSLYAEVSVTILIVQAVAMTGAATFILTRPSGVEK